MYPSIVADIGGTNARFALVNGRTNDQFTFSDIHILPTCDYPSFSDALRAYIARLPGLKPKAFCAAIAGPVVGDAVQLTNVNWAFSCKAVAEEFGLARFIAMNDFAAVAAAAGDIHPEHLINIKPGRADPHGNKAVFGPGTGLGVAGVVNSNGKWLPLPSEGGHVNLAPSDAFEADIIKAAMATHGHVSAEVFISGPGLVHLYQAIAVVQGVTANAFKPSDITQHALAGTDELCLLTLNTFCSFIGSFAGNLALTYGATGGVYMAGGILPRFADFLRDSHFTEKFTAKGAQKGYVANVPADLIVHPEVAFAGAAAWLTQHLG
ncbi:MAG: glucokinase [Pseudomonadota bacterium]|jgi:glucokinase